MLSKIRIKGWTGRAAGWMLLTAMIALASPVYSATNSNVPPVVVTSTGTVPATGLAGGETDVAVDACGNIYAVQQFGGEVDRIPAGGGAASVVLAAGGANYTEAVLSMDASKSNLYVVQGTNGAIKIPITNCVPQTSSTTSIGIGNLPESSNGWGYLSWYFSMSAVAADQSGNVFMATDVACCSTVNSLVEEVASGGYSTGTPLLGWSTSLPLPVISIAVDFNYNLYYVMGCAAGVDSGSGCNAGNTPSGVLYELPVATPATATAPAVYSTTPVLFGSGYSNNVVGVTVDSQGNLFVADGGNSAIYEIPYETTGSTAALNPAHQFQAATGVALQYPAAPDMADSFYLANNSASVNKISRGSANLGAVAAGSSAIGTVNVAFNAAETPASFTFSPNNAFTSAGGTCQAGSYSAGQSCTVITTFAPVAPGVATGGLTLADASHNLLATSYLEGTGQGAGLTLDSGAVASIGSGFTSPQSIAVTNNGGYVADSGKNAVLYFATPTSSPVSVGSALSKPLGVTVDGAGNVIIADTGNNQIVEVPVINGALSNSAQVVLLSSSTSIAGAALKAPAGVTLDGQGNLYISDTGNNRVVYVPYNGSWEVAQASALGSGLTAPLATAVDPSGILYIADSGAGQIYKYSNDSQQLVAVGFNNPSALATDASGSLFVVDQGANSVFRIPNVAGALNPNAAIEVGFGVAAPYGMALDSIGNLYLTEATHAAAYQLNRVSTTESFGDWALNIASGALPVKVANAGNQTLTFATPFTNGSGNTTDFSLGTPTSAEPACANGGTLAAGAVCELDAIFTPTVSGSRSDTLVLASNAQNATAPQVVLSGNGLASTATTTALAVTTPSGTLAFGEAITLTATITSSATPTGSAQLLVDGVITGESTLSSSIATFTLPMGLTGGSHSLQAVYLGSSTLDGSSSAVLKLVVSTAPTATALAMTTPYTTPYSSITGNSVSLVATIGFAGVGIPTGTVTFAAGVTSLGTASVAPVAGGLFQASISTTALPVGVNAITATYSGDANYVGSVSAAGMVTVVKSAQMTVSSSGLSLTSSASNSSSVTFSGTSYGGWNGIVGFVCDPATLPANAVCTFTPGQASVLANTASSANPVGAVTLSVAIDQPPQTPTASSMVWWVAGFTGLALLFVRRRLKKLSMAHGWSVLLLIAAVGALSTALLGITACSSSAAFPTPIGSSTVTVYAYADSFISGTSGSTVVCSTLATSPCSTTTFKVNLTVQ